MKLSEIKKMRGSEELLMGVGDGYAEHLGQQLKTITGDPEVIGQIARGMASVLQSVLGESYLLVMMYVERQHGLEKDAGFADYIDSEIPRLGEQAIAKDVASIIEDAVSQGSLSLSDDQIRGYAKSASAVVSKMLKDFRKHFIDLALQLSDLAET